MLLFGSTLLGLWKSGRVRLPLFNLTGERLQIRSYLILAAVLFATRFQPVLPAPEPAATSARQRSDPRRAGSRRRFLAGKGETCGVRQHDRRFLTTRKTRTEACSWLSGSLAGNARRSKRALAATEEKGVVARRPCQAGSALSRHNAGCLRMRLAECDELLQLAILGAAEACEEGHGADELDLIRASLELAEVQLATARALAARLNSRSPEAGS